MTDPSTQHPPHMPPQQHYDSTPGTGAPNPAPASFNGPNPPSTPSTRKYLPLLTGSGGLILGLILGLVVPGIIGTGEAKTFDVEGSANFAGRPYLDGCQTVHSKTQQFQDGTRVTLRNGAGEIISVSQFALSNWTDYATAPDPDGGFCEFSFNLRDVPRGERIYTLYLDEVRGPDYTEEELQEPIFLVSRR